MPLTSYEPFWPETAILWGAGASADLKVPTTSKMGETIRKLAESTDNKSIEERINEVSVFDDIETELGCFLTALEDDLKEDGMSLSNTSIEAAKKILPEDFTVEKIKKKILQWKSYYDWDALRHLAIKVPVVSDDYTLYITDLYNIIDGSLLSNHGVQVYNTIDKSQEFLYPHRLRAARNLLVLLSSLMMACAYHKTRTQSPENFKPYLEFVETLNELMQHETIDLEGLEYYRRYFYLMSYSIISFNFDPIFLWFKFMQNVGSNKNPPHIGKRNLPVDLFHDYAVFTVIKDGYNPQKVHSLEDPYNSPEGYYPVNETVARHINGIEDGGRLFRICKFYYVHGSTNIRECENCGKMMLVLGEWIEISEELFSPPPFRTKLFKRTQRTKEENDAHLNGDYDAIQCLFCGNMTYAHNTKMIMQTAYKGGHASFLEEIQRDAKVSLFGAKHIILMGYQLPPDDAVWRSAIVAKKNKDKIYCSVVVGNKGKDKWIKEEDELKEYLEEKKIKKIKQTTVLMPSRRQLPSLAKAMFVLIQEEYRKFGVRAVQLIKIRLRTCSILQGYFGMA